MFAVWLAREALTLSLKEAKEWVETVRLIDGPSERYFDHVSGQYEQSVPSKIASRWPPSVTVILNAKLTDH